MILTVWQVIYKTFLTIFVLTFSIYSVEYSGIQVNGVHRVLHGHSNGSIQKKECSAYNTNATGSKMFCLAEKFLIFIHQGKKKFNNVNLNVRVKTATHVEF